MYLKGRITHSEILYLLIHSDDQGGVRPKPGAQSSIFICHVGGRGSSAGITVHCFSRCIRRELEGISASTLI